MNRVPARERFWELVNGPWCDPRIGGDDCWLWMGATAGSRPPKALQPRRRRRGKPKPWKRYGRFRVAADLIVNAHRFALELCAGPPPKPDSVASHTKCDRPLCCNPAHLEWASPAGNILEAIAKGHLGRGPLGRFVTLSAAVIA